MKERKEVIGDCFRKPFKVIFVELGDYESLDYDFATKKEAQRKLEELLKEARKNNQPYFVELTKRLIVKSEE